MLGEILDITAGKSFHYSKNNYKLFNSTIASCVRLGINLRQLV